VPKRMTTIFVYEYCCALGLGREPSDPAHSLYREGRAMQDALAADFAALPETLVVTLENSFPDDEEARFRQLTATADWTVVIAPEFDRILEERCRWVQQSNGRLLGPNDEAVRLSADKYALFEQWRSHGVPTPETWLFEEFPGIEYPVVVKPRYGAGSTDTSLQFHKPAAQARDEAHPFACAAGLCQIVQPFIPGHAASVSFLVGKDRFIPLVPSFQKLTNDGLFQYQGGELPIPPDLGARAVRIATQAIACVPGLLGYIGVDLVLGTNPDGSDDRAIEINPRMTTSYVGLRALTTRNLAGAMLELANGINAEPIEWSTDRIVFRPNGSIERIERTD